MQGKIYFQGITPDTHLGAIKNVLGIPNPDRILISVAFLNDSGVNLIANDLAKVADRATVVAGIRNGITSAQGLLRCIDTVQETFAVDTGWHNVIFHPKVYLSRNKTETRLLVGSANLTYGGLVRNIEASVLLTVPVDCEENQSFSTRLEKTIDSMLFEHEDNIIPVTDPAVVQKLIESGQVIDEGIVQLTPPSKLPGDSHLSSVPNMKLKTPQAAELMISPLMLSGFLIPFELAYTESDSKKIIGEHKKLGLPIAWASPPGANSSDTPSDWELVWTSGPLSERHLNIPKGSGTHRTGSMLFGKGAMEDIDQRHYFRDEVFANLVWKPDQKPKKQHIERATANFGIAIRGKVYMVIEMRLSHNSRTDSKAYKQRNSMTQLHWDNALKLVATKELLGATATLYRNTLQADQFVLSID